MNSPFDYKTFYIYVLKHNYKFRFYDCPHYYIFDMRYREDSTTGFGGFYLDKKW